MLNEVFILTTNCLNLTWTIFDIWFPSIKLTCNCIHLLISKVVRIGHPARLLSIVQKHSLDALLSNSEGTAIVRDVRKDIDDTLV